MAAERENKKDRGPYHVRAGIVDKISAVGVRISLIADWLNGPVTLIEWSHTSPFVENLGLMGFNLEGKDGSLLAKVAISDNELPKEHTNGKGGSSRSREGVQPWPR